MAGGERMEIRMLGELEVRRGGHRVELPPSKKARALLAFLVATGRAHRRERLSSLLWDETDDRRAALRWNLSKLRAVLEDGGSKRIRADREEIAFEDDAAYVDTREVRAALAAGLEGLSVDHLRELAALFRGPFLEGLDLPDFGEFAAWRITQREELRHAHARLLRCLVDRSATNEAVDWAHELVRIAPDDGSARALSVRTLLAAGRRVEAEEHYRLGLRELERAGANAGELRATWASAATTAPATAPAPREQVVRFCAARDGTRIAYATLGAGPPLVKTANWMSHLEYDHKSPIWRHLSAALADSFTLVRYDQRGNGLSEWNVTDFSLEARVGDLEAVIDAARLERVALLGISQGCPVAIAYAARHPERVSRMVLYGGAARGWARRSPESLESRRARLVLLREGWGKENPAFRQLFTGLMMPGATPEQADWFNELQKVSCSAENAARLSEASGETDVTGLLAEVRAPVLVMHATGDEMVPFDEARILAAGLPNARFVALESKNHLLLGDEPAWPRFLSHLRAFLAEDDS